MNGKELAEKMMDTVGTNIGTLTLLEAIGIITTYALDVGTKTKDLQIARAILKDQQRYILKILETGCHWKNYN